MSPEPPHRRNSEPRPLDGSLEALARRLGVEGAVGLGQLFSRWPEIVGEAMAEHVQPVRIDRTALVVTVDHPAWATQVRRLALLARTCGLDGVICSPFEVAALRAELGPDFQLVVPGIRPAGFAVGDQKRVMGPRDAIDAGASRLVIGRPITDAPDPAAAARAIAASLA